jgi:glycosyltransferase involved in cell wall biosynthesis
VGDVTWNKNITMLAKAVKRANASCVFVGRAFADMQTAGTNPWLKELRLFAHEVKDDPRFIFPGYVENDVLASLYKNAMANVFLSHDEGFGFSYIEAASQKTPSILADIPVFHEIAGTHALFVNNKDEEMITQALLAIRDTSEQERTKLGIDANAHIKKYKNTEFKHSLQSVINALL